MKRLIPVALLTALLAGCAHDSPCVPVYDDQVDWFTLIPV